MDRIVISKSPKYGDKKYSDYVLENYQNLKNGIAHGWGCLCCSDLFLESTKHEGRKGTLKKEAFFIYWLYADINKLWTLKSHREGVPTIRKRWEKVQKILDELGENLDREIYDKHDPENINRIVRRYQKSNIIENILFRELGNMARRAAESSLGGFNDIPPNRYDIFSFVDDIFKIIESEGTIVKSRIRRISRPLQRIKKDFFELGIDFLIQEGRVASRIYSGRTFLFVPKKSVIT